MLIAHASQHLDVFEPAFAHAVALAARSGAAVAGIHVATGRAEAEPPRASQLLERWGLDAAVQHRWLTAADGGEDVADVLLEQVARLRPDLVVLSTRARSGFARLFVGSVAEGVARNLEVPTLLLPLSTAGFVDVRTGAVNLQRALLVAGSDHEAQRELDAMSMLSRLARNERCDVELLHVADGTPPPNPRLPVELTVTTRAAPGPLETAVAERAAAHDSCVVVMASRGHDQLSDVIWSSHTERVLHAVRRPMLWVPI